MKTLSYVKQAMAVALLISAAQATAMGTAKAFFVKAGEYANTVVTYPVVKFGGLTYQTKRDRVDAVAEVKNAQGKVTTKAVKAVVPRDHQTIAQSFAGTRAGTFLERDPSFCGIRFKGGLLIAGGALVYCAFGYAVVKACKYLFGTSKTEVVQDEQADVQEEAEPVELEEQKQPVEPTTPVAKIKMRNPAVVRK